jgi:hypothetical protein
MRELSLGLGQIAWLATRENWASIWANHTVGCSVQDGESCMATLDTSAGYASFVASIRQGHWYGINHVNVSVGAKKASLVGCLLLSYSPRSIVGLVHASSDQLVLGGSLGFRVEHRSNWFSLTSGISLCS